MPIMVDFLSITDLSAGFEYPHFHAWLRQAVEDFIEWREMEFGL